MEVRVTRVRAPWAERLTVALLSAAAILVLALAAWVEPDPRGYGTHERLGLPPCGLMAVTGVPCPSCGLTTSFAHAVRLHPLAAARAQPLGLLLVLVAFLCALAGPVVAWLGTPLLSRLPVPVPRSAGVAFLAAIGASWIYKILATFVWAQP
jgi:hypothetical protein